MGPAYFVIAVLGCADGGSQCTPVATLPTRYATQTECVAATGAALIENSNFDYPTLVARCHPGEAKAAEAKPHPPRRAPARLTAGAIGNRVADRRFERA